jgi:hypothetical protein
MQLPAQVAILGQVLRIFTDTVAATYRKRFEKDLTKVDLLSRPWLAPKFPSSR